MGHADYRYLFSSFSLRARGSGPPLALLTSGKGLRVDRKAASGSARTAPPGQSADDVRCRDPKASQGDWIRTPGTG
jgi:hypothetical protein